MSGDRRTALKSSLARTVFLEEDERGGRRIVKRFRSSGPWARLRDRSRARREFAILRELHARGASVPQPLALSRSERAWEVAMEWLPATRSLDALFRARSDPSPLAAPLGRLLARLHGEGLDHCDLHPGNVLVGEDGRVWAIDFHVARLRADLTARVLRRDLARLAAETRELAPPRFRARALLAWWSALPPGLQARVGPLEAFAEQVELLARAERRKRVFERRLRWTRDGGAVRAVAGGDCSGFERADLPAGTLRHSLAKLATVPPRSRCLLELDGRRVLAVRAESADELRERWHACARLQEHRIPAARPLLLCLRPPAVAVFELPEGAEFLEIPSRPDRRLALELGRCAGALHDRGLWIEDLRAEPWIRAAGGLCLTGAERLRASDGSAAEEVQSLLARLAPSRSERAAFLAGYLREQRCGRAALERLRKELLVG